MMFAAVVALSFIGGILYVPVYGDGLCYRPPRMFHWVAEGKWHWIHTDDIRMNVVGPNPEWLWTPIWIFTRNEKWCFLISFISYLFLPGVSFAYFRRLGISARVSWWWMWLLPTGYCYAFQASSIASDGYAATFALAALLLAFRARDRRSGSDLLCSLLSIALITGVKQTNLLLVALWIVPALQAIPRVRVPKLLAVGCVVIALLISLVPISYLNQKHEGNWKGFPTGTTTRFDQSKIQPDSIFWGITGNAFALTCQNLLPPYFPWAWGWNAAMERWVDSPSGKHFRSFEKFGFLFRAPAEYNAGFGLGLCLLVVVSTLGALSARGALSSPSPMTRDIALLVYLPWLLLLVFMAKISVFENARYLAPYYPFLLPLFLRQRGQYGLVRRPWWRWSAGATVILTIAMIILSRQRPLWPGHAIANIIGSHPSGIALAERVRKAFDFSDESPRTLAWLRQALPDGSYPVAYAVTLGYSEAALWHAPSVARVWRFLPTDDLQSLRSRETQYLLVDPSFRKDDIGKQTLERLLDSGGEIISKSEVHAGPESPPEELWLMRVH